MTTQQSPQASGSATVLTQPTLVEERPAASSGAGFGRGLLDTLLDATPLTPEPQRKRLPAFLAEPSVSRALLQWLGSEFSFTGSDLKQRIARQLNQDIARLDDLLTRQVNAILHHPRFQRLEASWRGLHYLAFQVPEGEGGNIKIRVLNVSWHDLVRDLERALEFDQTQLFRKVYEDEFGMPGGEPFGALLGDYELYPWPGADHPTVDLDALRSIAGVAAAAFTPFITSVHPNMFGLDGFTEMERPLDLQSVFEQPDYIKWRTLRDSEDARFLGLTMPRVLMRLPYGDTGEASPPFRFHEDIGRTDRREYLWGNAVYAFGGVLVRNFARSGWLASIRGVKRDSDGGGLVTGLPAHSFSTDRSGVVPKCSTDVIITDSLEKELGDLGFLPLFWCQDTGQSAFHGTQSVQKPAVYDEMAATMNARLSAMLQYMFCVSRFAHYLKVMARDKLGAFFGPAECEDYLRRWLMNYINANDNATDDLKAKHPLREARVKVDEIPGSPGKYRCTMHFRPQFQLEQMMSAIRLVTTLGRGQPG